MSPLGCRVCAAEGAQYVCPRCNIRYCSVECYKKHSSDCTQKFYRYGKLCNQQQTNEPVLLIADVYDDKFDAFKNFAEESARKN